jgi:WD40 repeat protein
MKRPRRWSGWKAICLLWMVWSLDPGSEIRTAAAAAEVIDFNTQVLPLFRKHCNGCHNAQDREGGLVLEDFARTMKGGETGPQVVAGKVDESRLWRLISGADEPKMPPDDAAPLPAESLATIRAWIEAGAPAPQGGLAASGLVTRYVPPQVPVRRLVVGLAIDPRQQWIAVAYSDVVEISSFDRTQTVAKLSGQTGIISGLALSADGEQLVVGSGEVGLSGEATIWNTRDWSRRQVISGHRDSIYAVALSSDGKSLATASYDREIRTWDTSTGALQHVMAGHNDAVYSVAFAPNTAWLASASGDRTIKLWSPQSGQRLETLAQPSKEQYSVSVSPNGRHIVAGGVDARVRVWDVTQDGREGTNPLLYARFAHEAPVIKVLFSPDGKYLISASEDRRIKVWETQTFTETAVLPRQTDWPAALAFTADSQKLYVGRLNGELAVYDMQPSWSQPASDLQPLSPSPMPTALLAEQPNMTAVVEAEPNSETAQAQSVAIPSIVSGRLQTDDHRSDSDHYRFAAKAGDVLILETNAARKGSAADTKLEVLDVQGQPVLRGHLQAVRDSWITFRAIDSDFLTVRVEYWEEMDLNQFLYMNGEIGKFYLAPRGPDSGYDFYQNAGKRRTYFDTTAMAHAKEDRVYVVEAFTPGAKLVDNGLPVFPLYFVNDDDGERELGADSRLTFVAPHDGEFIARVTDSRGFQGEKYDYDLTLRPARPDFSVSVATRNAKVFAGSGQRMKFVADRKDNFDGPIEVRVENLPAGYQIATPTIIQAGHLEAFSVLTADVDAAPADKAAWDQVRVTATATVLGQTVERSAENLGEVKLEPKPTIRVVLKPDQGSHATAEGDLVIQPGTTITAQILVERNGFDAGIRFDVDNLPHGIIVDNIGLSGVLVRTNETERQIFLTARPWVPETTVRIHAVAQGEGNQASAPIQLHVRAGNSTVAQNKKAENAETAAP